MTSETASSRLMANQRNFTTKPISWPLSCSLPVCYTSDTKSGRKSWPHGNQNKHCNELNRRVVLCERELKPGIYISMQSVEWDTKTASQTNGQTPAVKVTFAPEKSTSEWPPFLVVRAWPWLMLVGWLYCCHRYIRTVPWLQVIFITIQFFIYAIYNLQDRWF